MLALCLSFSIALLDQVTKYVIRRNLLSGHITVIPGLLDLRYVQNTGAAWGMLEGLNNWLVVLSVIMLTVIVAFRRSLLTDALIHRIVMGLMVGGIGCVGPRYAGGCAEARARGFVGHEG